MMSFAPALLSSEVQEFIHNFEGDTTALAFAGSPFPEVSVQELLQQIEGRKRIEKKLPTWFQTRGILYPPRVNLEQTSSEATATYKASLIEARTIADLTAGWGVDSFYFAKAGMVTTAFEQVPSLAALSQHNASILQPGALTIHHQDGLEAIKDANFDALYIDPSRRHQHKGKVFFLEDCEPNVPKHLEYLLNRCEYLWVKTSPMLDIQAGIKSLQNVSEVHVIAVHNEVKELLWKIEETAPKAISIVAVNLNSDYMEPIRFEYKEDQKTAYAAPGTFLYEPNAALMKTGMFEAIAHRFEVAKLAAHTHLYTSEEQRMFPGRTFRIRAKHPYSKRSMRTVSSLGKANITIRNFPESVHRLRKKWNLKEGGNSYLFFTTLATGDRCVLICEKI